MAAEPRVRVFDAMSELWHRGDLRFLLRPNAQREIHDTIMKWKLEDGDNLTTATANCHRRLGKSFEGVNLVVSRCLAEPYTQAKYGAPTDDQVRDIVIPNLYTLLESCPPALRPKKTLDGWEFRNPRWQSPSAYSLLKIVGANYRRGDRLRGMATDIAVLDEVRDIERLEYIIKDILSFQFVGRKSPLLFLVTTPPQSMDHDWVTVILPKCRRNKRSMTIPITANPDWSKADEAWLLDLVGAKDSISWRREALCELVSDEHSLLVPEYQWAREECFRPWKRPSHFQPQCGMDTGWFDFTAVEYCYVDWFQQKLIFDREIVEHHKTTKDIAEKIKELEKKEYPHERVRRFGDATVQQLEDLSRDHKVYFRAADKYDRESAIAKFRGGFQRGQIIITPDCPELDTQLLNGTMNEDRTRIVRTKNMGHCDALMAAVYAYRMTNFKDNPYPDQLPDIDYEFDYYQMPRKRSGQVKTDKHPCGTALMQALGRKRLN